jgi:hypothetical protein
MRLGPDLALFVLIVGPMTIGTLLGTLVRTGLIPDSLFAPFIAGLIAAYWVQYYLGLGDRK